VRVLDDPPWTPTHKLQKHKLQRQQFNREVISDAMWIREGDAYVPFEPERYREILELFEHKGRTKVLALAD